MRVVVGVDWSEESFSAVAQLALLYRPEQVAIVHGVDLGLFQSPMVAQAANLQGYDDFRRSMIDAGRQVVNRARTLLPADIPSVQTLCDVQHAASYVLEQAQATGADLIAVGTHDRSRLAEMLVGSVSHHVLLQSRISTLLVKGKAHPVSRVLLAVEGQDDASTLQSWLIAHPFRNPVAVSVLSVVPLLHMLDPMAAGLENWTQDAMKYSETIVRDTARALSSPSYSTTSEVRTGDPATTICDVSREYDLIVVSAHRRTGFDRLLLGSVSHGIVHRAPVSVLVVR